MGKLRNRFFALIVVLLFVVGIGNSTQDDDVTRRLEADTMSIFYHSTQKVEEYNVNFTLVFNTATLTCGEVTWTTFGEAEVFKELKMFSIYATDGDGDQCQLWFMFEDRELFKIRIVYKGYSFLFERKYIKT